MITLLRQQGIRNGSGAILAQALGIPHSGPESYRRCRGDRFVINWGCSTYPEHWRQRSIAYSNSPNAVSRCVNKLTTLDLLHQNHVPAIEHDVGQQAAAHWLEEDGKIVVRRTVTGHSGQGIQVVRTGMEIPPAPLYTRYFKKDAEYRAHVFRDEAILIQQKRRGDNYDGSDRDRNLIRTNANGWCFCINDLDCDDRGYREALVTLAVQAIQAIGAGHGAVDILVKHPTRKENEAKMVVCEVNSAPALRNPTTLNVYVEAFNRLFYEARG